MVREGMRRSAAESYVQLFVARDARVRKDHPLRAIRAMVGEVLTEPSRRFDMMSLRLHTPEFRLAQQLCVCGHDDSGEAHRDRPYAHR